MATLKQKQINDSHALSQMLEKTMGQLSCGPECQEKKKLKDVYLTSEAACDTAPTARKEYITFAKGEDYYASHEEKRLAKVATRAARQLSIAFAKQVEGTEAVLDAYDTITQEVNFGGPLVRRMHAENALLAASVAETGNDAATNDRKGYYAIHRTATNDRRTKIVTYLYFFLAAVWTALGLYGFYQRRPSSKAQMGKWAVLTTLMWSYPWYVGWVVRLVAYVMATIKFYTVSVVSNIISL